MQPQKLNRIQSTSTHMPKDFPKTKPKVGPLMDPVTKSLTEDSSRMANILQDQYKSVFTIPKKQYNLPDIDASYIPEQLADIGRFYYIPILRLD